MDVRLPFVNGQLYVIGRDRVLRPEGLFHEVIDVRGPQIMASLGKLPPRVKGVAFAADVNDPWSYALRIGLQVLIELAPALADVAQVG